MQPRRPVVWWLLPVEQVTSPAQGVERVQARCGRLAIPNFKSKAGDIANMAKVIVVTSGKGGVGKTTTTAALGAALAQTGQKVAVVDFDVGLRNLDLVMGAERRRSEEHTSELQSLRHLVCR